MISVFSKDLQAVTCVPNSFIDKSMCHANGDYVKVYLYLLRSMSVNNGAISISAMAEAFNLTESDVTRALLFWETEGLLSLSFNEAGQLSGICMDKEQNAQSATPAPVPTLAAVPVSAPAVVAPRTEAPVDTKKAYSAEDLSSFKKDPEAADLLFATEKYLGHPLSVSEVTTILDWHDALGLPLPLIEHLIEESIEAGHKSLHYMNKIALNWSADGISSVEDAKRTASIHSQLHYGVMRAMGISGRDLVPSEKATIDKWTSEYGYALDIIQEACRRTVANTGKSSFSYADAILTSWYKAGVKHTEDIAGQDSASKAVASPAKAVGASKISDFPSRDYDFSLLEQQLLKSQID